MSSSSMLERLLRALFGFAPAAGADIVGFGNLAVAGLFGIAAGWRYDFSWPVALAAAFVVFVALTALLLHQYTFWVSAALGGLALSLIPAGLLAGLGARVFPVIGAWLGAGIGLLLGLAIAYLGYRDIMREARRR